MRVKLVKGDITKQSADVIVNAANASLLGGSGVDGAIHKAGGPEILAACKRLRETTLPDGLPPGQAVLTTAGNLDATYVIHTAGPRYDKDEDRSGLLYACYRSALALAGEVGARSIAFPAISTGVYGWPAASAARIALAAVTAPPCPVGDVRFVLFGDDMFGEFSLAAAGARRLRTFIAEMEVTK